MLSNQIISDKGEDLIMDILVLCDDRWHPAKVVRDGLAPLENQGYHFTYIEDAADFSTDLLKAYPIVILSKSNNISSGNTEPWMTDFVQETFASYVKDGGGLLVIHSGTAGYQETAVLRGLMGGVFLHHPEQCPVTMKMTESSRLTDGFVDYTEKDEHYHMSLDDVSTDVFMTTVSEHGTQPGGWTRVHGDGRVCVLTPGHNVEVWLHPSFQRLLQNSIDWCTNQ
jgi:type 1 glutamine amidotransferase